MGHGEPNIALWSIVYGGQHTGFQTQPVQTILLDKPNLPSAILSTHAYHRHRNEVAESLQNYLRNYI